MSCNKLQRRMSLLDDAIDVALRQGCMSPVLCRGFEAPIREMQTCARCALLHRAIKMKLLVKDKRALQGTFPYTQQEALHSV